MSWTLTPDRSGQPFFVSDKGQRIRQHNLTCAEGDLAAGVMGSKHTWESWGIATATAGTFARDVEMFVCTNPDCMRVKYGPTICRN